MRSLFFGDISSGKVKLAGEEGHHAADVLRVRVGEEIDVSDNAGQYARVLVTQVSKSEVVGEIQERFSIHNTSPRITVAQALIKGSGMSESVDLMTQVGVHEIAPWHAERSVAHWEEQRAAKSIERLRFVARTAAKQSRNPLVLRVDEVISTDKLIATFPNFPAVVVLHEEATTPLASFDIKSIDSLLMVVGPEGGISPREIDQMVNAGATLVRLGTSVIRSIHAGAIGASVVFGNSSWR
jgi:16S rRNA (uracil1498-N3)-methyltransferase